MSEPTDGKTNSLHSMARTVVMYVLVGVIAWVGLSIQKQTESINNVNVSNAKLEQKVEDLGVTISASVPQLVVDMASTKARVDSNERRLSVLEARDGAK